jgi:GDPmannose 4,6-dehydratase
VFAEVGLDWRNHVDIDRRLFRPNDIRYSRGNADKARRELAWQATTSFDGLVRILVTEAQMAPLSTVTASEHRP